VGPTERNELGRFFWNLLEIVGALVQSAECVEIVAARQIDASKECVVHVYRTNAEGVVCCYPWNPDRKDPKLDAFRDRCRKRFPNDPEVETYAAHAYDGMNMLLWAIQAAGLNRAKIRDVIAYRTEPWHGVTGEIPLSSALDDFGGPPPQLFLLLAADPMKFLLSNADEPELLESGQIDRHDCYRVRIGRSDGAGVLWIDREAFLLRRLVFPTDDLRRQFALALHARAKVTRRAHVHHQEEREFAFFDKLLHERPAGPCRHIPVDGAHIVAGHVFAHGVEVDATAFEDTVVLAGE
jgi:hypothetical protein